MTLKLNGTNSEAAPAYAGDDADTGLQCGTNELKLVTGGTARATVDSSGQVGVGLTSPSSLLHLKSTSFPQLTVERDGSGTQGAGLKLVDGSGDENRIFTTDSSIVFDTGASSTPLARFQSGGGISFGNDTAAANALSDYEEGTWTPTCASDGGIGTSQYTCTYTKIGRLVTINCDIHALDNITSTNPIKIGGLPFVPSVTSGEYGSSAVHGERVGSSLVVAFLQYLGNSWVIRFRKGVGSSNYSDVDHSDLNNAGDNNMRFSLTYEIVA